MKPLILQRKWLIQQWFLFSVIGTGLVLLGACKGGSPYCEEEAHVLHDPSENTPLRFTPASILQRALGEHTLLLHWHPLPDERSFYADIGAAGTQTTATLRIEDVGDPGTYVQSRLITPRGPVNDVGVSCPPRVEIRAKMHLNSADGRFNETWDVVLFQEGFEIQAGQAIPEGLPEPVTHFSRDLQSSEFPGSLTIVKKNPSDLNVAGFTIQFDFREPSEPAKASDSSAELNEPVGPEISGSIGVLLTKNSGASFQDLGSFSVAPPPPT